MKDLTKIEAIPLRGGCITAKEKATLPFGAFPYLQNIRNTHPGFKQRPGQRKAHTTADEANKVLTLYQFKKTHTSEKHFYAQMSDGDVLEATNNPPTVTSGVFGAEVFDGSANQIPASWGNIGDKMLFSNGVNPHQIYGGTSSPIDRFIVFKGSAAIPDVPQGGEDYSDHVQSAGDSMVAILDSLDTYANYDCIFFRTPVPCNGITVTLATGKENDNAATLSIHYWKNDSTWAAVSGLTDGTDVGGDTLKQSGTITWTFPTDIIPKYAFGSCGFWYQIRVSAALDSEVEVSAVTYTSPWQAIVNVWDGAVQYAVEAHVEGTSQWEVYPAGAVDLDALASGKKIYVGFTDPVEGIYIDPGGTPNASGTTLISLKYWDGDSWESVGTTTTDGTVGMSQAGWITFPRKAAQPLQLHTSVFQAYWYEIIWSAAIAADTMVSIQGMPYFDMAELGNGYCNAVWKDRACYSFDRYGAYIYVTAKDAPLVLNGNDYGILKAGDGRANRVVGMKRFHNELIAWQEELGVEGGCVTLFEGYSPTTFGKLVLSSRIGSMNAKCQAVVDGVLTATATEETIKTLAFFLSRYGVCVTDGMTISIVSDDIQNYFDPTKPECIRYGYEKEMWLEHDATFNVIRIGLVSGASATTCNVFPVFDLATKTWSFDVLGQALSCIAGVEAGSGQAPVVMVGGGVGDGTVYQLNYGADDVSTAVRFILRMALNYKGLVLQINEILLRMKAQSAGAALLSAYEGERSKFSKSLPMIPERTGDTSRRHRFGCEAVSDLITLEITNNAQGETLEIFEIGVATKLWEAR